MFNSNKKKKKEQLQAYDDAKDRLEEIDRKLVVYYLLENNMKQKIPKEEILFFTLEKVNNGQLEYIEFLQFYLGYLSTLVILQKEISKQINGKLFIIDSDLHKKNSDLYSKNVVACQKEEEMYKYYNELIKTMTTFLNKRKQEDNEEKSSNKNTIKIEQPKQNCVVEESQDAKNNLNTQIKTEKNIKNENLTQNIDNCSLNIENKTSQKEDKHKKLDIDLSDFGDSIIDCSPEENVSSNIEYNVATEKNESYTAQSVETVSQSIYEQQNKNVIQNITTQSNKTENNQQIENLLKQIDASLSN